MDTELVLMSRREIERAEVMRQIAERRMTQRQAALTLQLSVRQIERLYASYKRDGAAGLASKKRGSPGNNRYDDVIRGTALGMIRRHYSDFGPTLAHEKLTELHGFPMSVETVRQWMIDDGLWMTRAERKKRVQQPRHRRDCYGELIQIDGCDHPWFEDRGPRAVLLVYVDDATGMLMELHMRESESAFSYFEATRNYLERHGKPVALYSDKAGVFRVHARSPKAGDGFTQFGRAMSDLNIDVICANTPAAKGRVERAHQTLQDRLVKELRLAGVCSIEEANAFLPQFMADYNRRFGRMPRVDHDAHRALLPQDILEDVFTWQETRKVTRNLTFRFKRTMYLLEPSKAAKRAAGKHVTVHELEDGALFIRFEGKELSACAFDKDRRVSQGAIVENKLLGAALEHIRKQQQHEELEATRLASAKTKRDKRLIRNKFAAYR